MGVPSAAIAALIAGMSSAYPLGDRINAIPLDPFSFRIQQPILGPRYARLGTANGSPHVQLRTNGPTYSITYLGTVPGYTQDTDAYGVNSSDEVAGRACCGPQTYVASSVSVRWVNGILQLLPGFPGYSGANGLGINDAGYVAGFSAIPSANGVVLGNFQGVLWDPAGHIINLGLFPGDTGSVAWGVNNRNHAVAISYGPTHDIPNVVLYHDGTVTKYGDGYAYGMNNNDVLVGRVNNTAALFFKDGPGIFREPGNIYFSLGQAVNDRNVAVGYVAAHYKPNLYEQISFIASNGRLEIIPPPAGIAITDVVNGNAAGINNQNEVVGFYDTVSYGQRAYIYRDGQSYDLNTMIPPNTGWLLNVGESINDCGDIAGTGTYHGEPLPFLLRPIAFGNTQLRRPPSCRLDRPQ